MKNGLKILRPCKILLLTDSMSFGGSERSVQILANNLISESYSIYILSLANEWSYNVNPQVIKSFIYNKNYSFVKKIILLPITFLKLRNKIRKIAPDIIISFTPQSNLLNAMLAKHGRYGNITSERQYAEEYYGEKNIIAKPVIKWMHDSVDAIIVNDIAIKDSLENYYNIKKNIFIVNNLLDKATLPHMEVKDKSNNDYFKFITIGRLSAEKNTKDIIKALSNIENKKTVLEIIGDGPLRNELETLVQQLKLSSRVTFRGYQKNPFQFLIQADAFVFSSLNEGFPNVILEAMSCNLPIISYHFKSGINTILDGGNNGMLVDLGNVNALSKSMRVMVENDDLRQHYIQKSKETIRRFSDKDAYINMIKEIIHTVIK